jgi:hypothetical protein
MLLFSHFGRPPLKTAMVFGGIAGIVPAEHGDPDDLGRIPSINTSRETGDLQDMYRRTLAASWTCREGELPPDQLIEDLFGGGSGWTAAVSTSRSTRSGPEEYDDSGSTSDTDSRRTIQGHRLSPNPEKRLKSSTSLHSRNGSKGHDDSMSGSIERQIYDSSKEKRWRNRSQVREISEFNVRRDLRSWDISVKD